MYNTIQEHRIIGYKGRPRSILLVDDHQENRTLMRNLLEPLGFDIVEAANGLDALESIQQALPDLIFMDLLMPGIDGFEATRRIRQEPSLSQALVIAISASVPPQFRQKSLQAGCNDFLTKPIHIDKLLACIQVYLKLEWLYEEPSPPHSDEQLE